MAGFSHGHQKQLAAGSRIGDCFPDEQGCPLACQFRNALAPLTLQHQESRDAPRDPLPDRGARDV